MPTNDELRQGPSPMPRNMLADLARSYGLHGLSGRLNDPTSGAGLIADGVGGLIDALVVSPAQSFNRLLQQGYTPGDTQGVEDAFNAAGGAMVGGLVAPRPGASLGAGGRPTRHTQAWQDIGRMVESEPWNALMAQRQAADIRAPANPYQAYRGSAHDSVPRDGPVWGSSNPSVAASYADMAVSDQANIMPLEFRFKNPLTVNAGGSESTHVPFAGTSATTDEIARHAAELGHDGVVFKRVRDTSDGHNGPAQTTYAALQPGTTYSPLTGSLIYGNSAGKNSLLPGLIDEPQTGIRAYHGSPHDFNTFDMNKASGNNGTLYGGGGIYLSDRETFAQTYKSAGGHTSRRLDQMPLQPTTEAEIAAVNFIKSIGVTDEPSVVSILKSKVSNGEVAAEVLPALRDVVARAYNAGPGRMYEVNIGLPPDRLYQYGTPLAGQSDHIRNAVPSSIDQLTDAKDVASMLKASGVRGMIHKDKDFGIGSVDGVDVNNYLMFDPSVLNILRKYGIAGAAASGPVNSLLAQYQGQTQR